VSAADDLARANAFGHRLFERTSTSVEPWSLGRAFFHDGFRVRYDSNFLLVERPVGGVPADRVADEADRVLARFPHREIAVDDERDGATLAIGLAPLGYRADRLLVMAQRRAPERTPPPEVDVREAPLEELRPFHLEVMRRDPATAPAAEPLADFKRVLRDEAGARFFLARVGGEAAAACELFPDGDVAQVEDVNTLAEFRGRGLATAVVLAAVDAARSGGADLVFLHADASDWPQHLYERLGFDTVGQRWSFLRPPDRPSPPIPGDTGAAGGLG
jgi:ribosomal protein S18 acetylase RimI-like enzyme